MAIIVISRGSYSRGREIAEKVAEKLGYECVSRENLLETSKEFDIPALRLTRAIEDIPSILDRFKYSKQSYIAYIQAALLERLSGDQIVYHGFAAHFFVSKISHVLNVRITADLEDRIETVMERDGISREEALAFLNKIDDQRKKWTRYLYGIDPADASHYDLVMQVKKIPTEAIVDSVCRIAGLKELQPTAESRQAMEDLTVAAKVRTALLGVKHNIDVSAQAGVVSVRTSASIEQEPDIVSTVERIAKTIPGVKDVNVRVLFQEHPL
jgi:cytidylate kinase